MNHIPFTLTAYFFNALAVLANKFLLNKTIPDPLIYVFYISLASLLVLPAIPFSHTPQLAVFGLASFSTLLWTLGAYFMFKALKTAAVSRVIPVIGTLIPLILLVFASETNAISTQQLLAVWFLTAGMIFLTLSDWRGKIGRYEILFEILSAVFFAFSYIILRQAYLKADFFSVLVWSRLIILPFAAIVLLIPSLRKKIITAHGSKLNFLSGAGLVFIGSQLSGMFSEFLLLFSISLANPALVNSLQGTQYIFLLFFALILSKKYPAIFGEKFTFTTLLSKIFGIALIGVGLFLLAS
ncbi:MAG: hypothetical protein Q8Q91_01620 [Candidatus Daviesbacteria bacterium]|nr:hypothetical protein [Candidatus Daviesbacteria bacterium]